MGSSGLEFDHTSYHDPDSSEPHISVSLSQQPNRHSLSPTCFLLIPTYQERLAYAGIMGNPPLAALFQICGRLCSADGNGNDRLTRGLSFASLNNVSCPPIHGGRRVYTGKLGSTSAPTL